MESQKSLKVATSEVGRIGTILLLLLLSYIAGRVSGLTVFFLQSWQKQMML